jgi:NAD(P)-dependent dehydrogenase (short-subunit alcohol dehydrogenase family)
MNSDMTGKTVLVTGATNGIGLETAKGLAALGAHVLVHGRSAERGAAALDEIKKAVPAAKVEFVKADLSSLAGVRGLAEEVLRRSPKLDVLVNNAGGIFTTRTITADGIETTLAVNHLAPFYLTNLLLDRIKASAPARIVTVASSAHRGKHIHFDDLNTEKNFPPGGPYGQSKLANILFARALAMRLAGTGVTSNSLHPGAVRTGFAKDATGITKVAMALLRPFFISPEAGARTSIYLASSPEVEGVSGKYFASRQKTAPSQAAQDDVAAEKLWAVSEKLVGLA